MSWDWACKRVVGVHKGLPWEMKVSAIRPEGCIPKVVQASFLLAVLRKSAELVFGGFQLVAHGGGMPARSGDYWSTGGGKGI